MVGRGKKIISVNPRHWVHFQVTRQGQQPSNHRVMASILRIVSSPSFVGKHWKCPQSRQPLNDLQDFHHRQPLIYSPKVALQLTSSVELLSLFVKLFGFFKRHKAIEPNLDLYMYRTYIISLKISSIICWTTLFQRQHKKLILLI